VERVLAKCVRRDGKWAPGDRRVMGREDCMSNRHWKSLRTVQESAHYQTTDQHTTSKSDPAKRLELTVDALPYRDEGRGLYGIAADVAGRVGHTLDTRKADALRAFLLDHPEATKKAIDDADDQE